MKIVMAVVMMFVAFGVQAYGYYDNNQRRIAEAQERQARAAEYQAQAAQEEAFQIQQRNLRDYWSQNSAINNNMNRNNY